VWKYTENTKLAVGVFWFFLMEFLQVRKKDRVPSNNVIKTSSPRTK
jgi:hypothetical protein